MTVGTIVVLAGAEGFAVRQEDKSEHDCLSNVICFAGKLPFTCDVCEEGFPTKVQLHQHTKSHREGGAGGGARSPPVTPPERPPPRRSSRRLSGSGPELTPVPSTPPAAAGEDRGAATDTSPYK